MPTEWQLLVAEDIARLRRRHAILRYIPLRSWWRDVSDHVTIFPPLCTWRVLRVPRQYIGTQTGLLGPGGGGVDCRLQYPLVSRIPRKGRPAVGSQV